MNRTVQLHIGADNITGLLDLPRIDTIVSKRHDGYTLWQAVGHWQGSEEPMAVVLISDTSERIGQTIAQLKSDLSQDAIGIIELPTMTFK